MRRAGLAAALAIAGCAHEQPFTPGRYGPEGPLNAGTMWRLTYSVGVDRMPAWTPGEAYLWYEFARTDRLDRDHCLGLLPYPGGARATALCDYSASGQDSTDVYESPSAAADGRLAFVHVRGRVGAIPPAWGEVLVSRLDGTPPARVMRLPPPTGGESYDRAGYIQWLGRDSLAFVAQLWLPLRTPLTQIYDTVLFGEGVDVLRLGDSMPVRVPGTDSATSLAAGDTAGVLYFTRFGDSRVYRLALAAIDTATLFDFGPLGIARDVQVRAGRLLAVVGGKVIAGIDPVFGRPIQRDSGGYLYFVDLAMGVPQQVGDPNRLYRRPALSRDGRTVGVEEWSPGQRDLWAVLLP